MGDWKSLRRWVQGSPVAAEPVSRLRSLSDAGWLSLFGRDVRRFVSASLHEACAKQLKLFVDRVLRSRSQRIEAGRLDVILLPRFTVADHPTQHAQAAAGWLRLVAPIRDLDRHVDLTVAEIKGAVHELKPAFIFDGLDEHPSS